MSSSASIITVRRTTAALIPRAGNRGGSQTWCRTLGRGLWKRWSTLEEFRGRRSNLIEVALVVDCGACLFDTSFPLIRTTIMQSSFWADQLMKNTNPLKSLSKHTDRGWNPWSLQPLAEAHSWRSPSKDIGWERDLWSIAWLTTIESQYSHYSFLNLFLARWMTLGKSPSMKPVCRLRYQWLCNTKRSHMQDDKWCHMTSGKCLIQWVTIPRNSQMACVNELPSSWYCENKCVKLWYLKIPEKFSKHLGKPTYSLKTICDKLWL